MNTSEIQSKIDEVIAEIHRRYNMEFVTIAQQKGADVYLFGGVLRDIYLGKPWKEIDIRVVVHEPYPQRDATMEAVLNEAKITVSSKIPFGEGFTVYRFVPPNSLSKTDVDLSVVSKHLYVDPDFTINGLYLNLATGKIEDNYGAVQAIEQKIIKTVLPPVEQLKNEPWMLFRAVKAACQFNFRIDEGTLEGMKANVSLARGFIQAISDKSMGGLTEWGLGNMFRGLKYNPYSFVEIWNETGLLHSFIQFIADKSGMSEGESVNGIHTANFQNPFKPASADTGIQTSYEEHLNIFFSTVARIIDEKDPQRVFKVIIDAFEIDQPKQFEDFVIDASQIRYI